MASLEFVIDVTPVVGPDDPEPQTWRLVARSRILGQWEREFRGRSLSGLGQMKVNDIEEIAWVGAKRDRGYTDNLDTFRNTHDVDILAPQDLAREDARARAAVEAKERGEPWGPEEIRIFDREFDREWDGDDDQIPQLGMGPTRRAR